MYSLRCCSAPTVAVCVGFTALPSQLWAFSKMEPHFEAQWIIKTPHQPQFSTHTAIGRQRSCALLFSCFWCCLTLLRLHEFTEKKIRVDCLLSPVRNTRPFVWSDQKFYVNAGTTRIGKKSHFRVSHCVCLLTLLDHSASLSPRNPFFLICNRKCVWEKHNCTSIQSLST